MDGFLGTQFNWVQKIHGILCSCKFFHQCRSHHVTDSPNSNFFRRNPYLSTLYRRLRALTLPPQKCVQMETLSLTKEVPLWCRVGGVGRTDGRNGWHHSWDGERGRNAQARTLSLPENGDIISRVSNCFHSINGRERAADLQQQESQSKKAEAPVEIDLGKGRRRKGGLERESKKRGLNVIEEGRRDGGCWCCILTLLLRHKTNPSTNTLLTSLPWGGGGCCSARDIDRERGG